MKTLKKILDVNKIIDFMEGILLMGLKSINTDGCKLKIFYISIVLRKKLKDAS